MAQQYDNEKRIALFPNDKGGNEKRPDYRGTLQLDGKEYKVSVWNRTSQRGPFLSGTIELAQPKQGGPAQSAPRPQPSQAPQSVYEQRPASGAASTEDVPFSPVHDLN